MVWIVRPRALVTVIVSIDSLEVRWRHSYNYITENALAQLQRVHNPQIFGTSPFASADFEASSTMCTRWFWVPELSRMHLHPQIQIPNAFLGTSPRDIFSYNDFGYRCIFWHHFPQSNKKNLLKSSLRGSISGSIIGKRGFPIFFKPCTPISLFLKDLNGKP